MNKSLIVIKREFLRSLKKPLFWVLTLWLPIFYMLIFWLSWYSTSKTVEEMQKKNDEIKNIIVCDESKTITNSLKNPKIKLVSSYEEWFRDFLANKAEVFAYYKADFPQTKKINLFVNSDSFTDSYSSLIEQITKTDVWETIWEKEKVELYNSPYQIETKKYKDWKELEWFDKKMLIWIIWAALYFFMLIFWNSFMLNSMIEEKENRMIEIIVSTIDSFSFIIWKIIWWLLLVLLQLFIIFIIPLIVALNLDLNLPFDLKWILFQISFVDWLNIIFYVISGFLIFAWLMVATWSAWSNQKEAWRMSSIFIILWILPIYVAWMIIANPKWLISMIFSYLPVTSPMVLLFRSSIWEFFTIEKFIAPIIVIIYIYSSFWIAKKMFEMWALEYSKNISWKSLFCRKDKTWKCKS